MTFYLERIYLGSIDPEEIENPGQSYAKVMRR